MNLNELVSIIEEMRKQQRAFFAARKAQMPEATKFLEKAKSSEKAVDDFCKKFREQEAKANTPELFK